MTEASDSGSGEGGRVLRHLLRARNGTRVEAGAAPMLPQPLPVTPARAAATAAGRAAERLYGMPAQPLLVTPGASTLAELAEIFPQPALFAIVQGPGDAVGVVALCPETVTALTEMQTFGRITARSVERRRFTASDAMISADFVNALLQELQAELSLLDGFEGYSGFRYASHLDDPRPLMLLLEDGAYRTLRLTLSVGGRDRRESQIFVALPQRRTMPVLAAPATSASGGKGAQPAQAGAAKPATAPLDSADLAGAVQAAPVEIIGVLCRRSLSVGQLRALTPGRTLTLHRVSLTDAYVETRGGQRLARGKLGEADGCYAIRLQDPITTPAAGAAPAAPFSNPARPAPALDPSADMRETLPLGDLALPDSFRAGATTPSALSGAAGFPADLSGPADLPGLVDLPLLDGPFDLPDLPVLANVASG